MANILVADDVAEIRFGYEQTLQAAGHTVVTAANGQEATDHLIDGRFDLVVTDLLMPKSDGVELATHAHTLRNRPALLVITGGSDRLSPYAALQMGDVFFDASLVKPVSTDVLLTAVEKLLAER